jgi:iron-sulfur cluster insertion protein
MLAQAAESTPAVMFNSPLSREDIGLSSTARDKLAELLASEEEVDAIRIYVAGGGCGGMTYGMTFTDEKTAYDRVLAEDGLKIYVDAVALGYLKGVEIDFRDTPTGGSFVFNNVFQSTSGSGRCGGCGATGGGCG